ncbi:MAG: carbohydrate ABC transporter permease [Anaerolineae bacterium]|nr:carbohydrate ABC transporter permease [Anaerolineae bacterium]
MTPKTVQRLVIGGSYVILSAGSIFMLFPFLWMISTSLKQTQYILQFPPQWIPNPINTQNYADIWTQIPLARGFLNSAFISITGTIGVLIASSLAGFSFAKLRFPGRDKIFVVLLVTLMIPGAILLVPQFILYKDLRWVGTYNPLIIPSLFGAVYETFFFRQFFRGLPNDLIDAAKIDGASLFTVFWRIAVPLSRPVFATLAVLAFMWRWNDYMGPLIYLQDPNMQTVPVLISSFQSQYLTQYGMLMAASVLSILPIVILFFFLQRYFVEGIAMTGLKG